MRVNSLRALDEKIALLEKRIEIETQQLYTWQRDEQGNLVVTYADGHTIKLPFIPFRPYQLELQRELFIRGCKRFLLERPRRSGKEVESWNLLIQAAITHPGLYVMVYPTNVRARAILWEGAMTMPNGKNVRFLDMVPARMLARRNNADMTVSLKNNSIIWILGSDIDPDKLRGTNPLGVVLSEFAFQDPRVMYVLMPALRQNHGWLLAQSTYDGQNHFYQMLQSNKADPLWYCREDSIETLVDENGNRYITDAMIEEDRRAGMPEYLIQQEYYGIVQVNQETKYFAHALNYIYENQRITTDLIQPNQNLYTAWDIGVKDATAIILFQLSNKNGVLWPNIVGYIENNNRELSYYVDECRQFSAKHHLTIHTHFIPHDGGNRNFCVGLKTMANFMADMGETAKIVAKPESQMVAIEAMRQKLHITSFEREASQRLIDCIANYSKEYDAKMGTYKDHPVHNWASHGVKAYQTMTLALDRKMIRSQATKEIIYYDR